MSAVLSGVVHVWNGTVSVSTCVDGYTLEGNRSGTYKYYRSTDGTDRIIATKTFNGVALYFDVKPGKNAWIAKHVIDTLLQHDTTALATICTPPTDVTYRHGMPEATAVVAAEPSARIPRPRSNAVVVSRVQTQAWARIADMTEFS
jgi:hypothetical protein